MRIYQIIKSSFSGVIKTSKKQSILIITVEILRQIVKKLTAEYKYFKPLLRLVTLFRYWLLGTFIMSLIYTMISKIFNFNYDYMFFVSIGYGLFLVFKEYIYSYYLDFNGSIFELLDKISNKLQGKVVDDSVLVDQKSVDKINKVKNEYINLDDVAKENRSSQFNSNNNDSLRKSYKDFKSNDDYSVFKDWRFWSATAIITIGVVSVIMYYNGYLDTDLVKNSYNRTRDWFFNNNNLDTNNSTDNNSGDSSNSSNIQNNDANNSSSSTTLSPGTEERNFYFKDGENDTTSGDITPRAESTPKVNKVDLPVNYCSNLVDWQILVDPIEIHSFNNLKKEVLGKIVYFMNQLSRLENKNISVTDFTSDEDYAFNSINSKIMDSCNQLAQYINRDFNSPKELLDILYKVALDEQIEPIKDKDIANVISNVIRARNSFLSSFMIIPILRSNKNTNNPKQSSIFGLFSLFFKSSAVNNEANDFKHNNLLKDMFKYFPLHKSPLTDQIYYSKIDQKFYTETIFKQDSFDIEEYRHFLRSCLGRLLYLMYQIRKLEYFNIKYQDLSKYEQLLIDELYNKIVFDCQKLALIINFDYKNTYQLVEVFTINALDDGFDMYEDMDITNLFDGIIYRNLNRLNNSCMDLNLDKWSYHGLRLFPIVVLCSLILDIIIMTILNEFH